jgi:hypothetical protein
MNHATLKATLLAAIALPASAFAAPQDTPDPYGILIKPIPDHPPFSRLRSSHELSQRPSSQKQLPWRQPKP